MEPIVALYACAICAGCIGKGADVPLARTLEAIWSWDCGGNGGSGSSSSDGGMFCAGPWTLKTT